MAELDSVFYTLPGQLIDRIVKCLFRDNSLRWDFETFQAAKRARRQWRRENERRKTQTDDKQKRKKKKLLAKWKEHFSANIFCFILDIVVVMCFWWSFWLMITFFIRRFALFLTLREIYWQRKRKKVKKKMLQSCLWQSNESFGSCKNSISCCFCFDKKIIGKFKILKTNEGKTYKFSFFMTNFRQFEIETIICF